MSRLKVLLAACAAAVLGMSAPMAQVQDYPTKPIILIVPFPAGAAST